ncbi:MAG: carboxypeptidase-like regulatory domain-containing protein [Chitinophagaceae bacterium]|nr:carboxypeptidase-like regulatory domain-containing protein [Chitinophagaceae bacterium]
MATEHTIKTFTALDIEKYQQGLLSPKERHDLEKAALDDPFLADALEGYHSTPVNISADLTELKNRLAEKTEEKKVIPLDTTAGKRAFPWLRVAAMIIAVAGAGLLVYQFAFNKKEEANIARYKYNKDEDKKPAGVPDSMKAVTDGNAVISTAPGTTDKKNAVTTQPGSLSSNETVKEDAKDVTAETNAVAANDDVKSSNNNISAPSRPDNAANAPVTVNGAANNNAKALEADTKIAAAKRKDAENASAKEGFVGVLNETASRQNRNVTANRSAEQLNNQYRANIFRGRVTDANNNAVPFANVTNLEDNVGTYTDARGNFNLTSPDTVLNVQIRGLGYNDNNLQLRNNVSNAQVVMQEDKSVAAQTISSKKINAERRANNPNFKLENEPEPEDGWDNYDSYLVNNLSIPDDVKGKQSGGGQVELSFEVNKYGEPINIKVTKSLCARCDQEAIRLIKEGPKWRRKARNGKTTVTISF